MLEYQYTRLKHGQIRQMILLPGRFDEPIKVQIKKRDLPLAVQEYEALSYVWGSQENPETLTIIDAPIRNQKRSLSVGQNLASALRHLRNETRSRSLWCDAVCINQKDLAERAAQVQCMGDIYRHANRVVVWLGPGSEDIYRAMQVFSDIASHLEIRPNEAAFLDDEGRRYAEESTGLALSRSDWKGLHVFFSLPWFTRLWVRQEIILAPDSAIIVSGTRQLLWTRVAVTILLLLYRREQYGDAPELDAEHNFDFNERLLRTDELRRCKFAISSNYDEFAILRVTQDCQCADPRDRIYGALGLMAGFKLPIDYNKSIRQVYMDFCIEYYSQRKTFPTFLQWCEVSEDPSWVPDFGRHRKAWLDLALKHSSLMAPAVFEVLPDRSCRLAAVRCGTIRKRTSPMPWNPAVENTRRICRSWALELLAYDPQTDSTLIDELVATITLGHLKEYHDAALVTLPEARQVFTQDIMAIPASPLDQTAIKVFGIMQNYLQGSAIFAIENGHFGIGTSQASEGDEVFVVLGCDSPIILRPVGNSKYRVVGPCYMNYNNLGETLLGSLPLGWQMRCGMYRDSPGVRHFVAPDGSYTFDDPRLEMRCPRGWERIEDDWGVIWREIGAEEWLRADPRLTPKFLEARGVNVEMLTIV